MKLNISYLSLILLFNILFLIPCIGFAESFDLYKGSRGQAMGGADSGVVNDETALLINPAGLGKLRNAFGTLLDPEIEFGEKMYNMYRAKAFSGFTDLSEISTTLDNSRDKHYHYKQQIFPSFVVKNYGFGILIKESLDARMSPDGSTITSNYFYDWVLATGFNFRIWDGRIKLGFTAKAINRVQASGDFPTNQSLKITDIGKEGYGLGADVGLILSAPWGWLPSISAVGHDIGNTKFTNTGLRYKLSTKPDEMKQDVDVAFSLFPIHANTVRSSFTFEQKHLLTANDYTNKNQLYHFGWELNLSDIAFIRLGMNGKYWTSGFEIASERTQVQLAYFAEDVGTTSSEEDRRWSLKAVFRY